MTIAGHDAYSRSTKLAIDYLNPCDPIRLGTILNSAIFSYEYLNSIETAQEMLRTAVREARPELAELNDDERSTALSILESIRTNLVLWGDDNTL